jgi:hypothetical protein
MVIITCFARLRICKNVDMKHHDMQFKNIVNDPEIGFSVGKPT